MQPSKNFFEAQLPLVLQTRLQVESEGWTCPLNNHTDQFLVHIRTLTLYFPSDSHSSIACSFPGCSKLFTLRSNMRRWVGKGRFDRFSSHERALVGGEGRIPFSDPSQSPPPPPPSSFPLRHLFTHTTPPQHQCGECPAAFHRRADLNTHMRVHTGEVSV